MYVRLCSEKQRFWISAFSQSDTQFWMCWKNLLRKVLEAKYKDISLSNNVVQLCSVLFLKYFCHNCVTCIKDLRKKNECMHPWKK